MVKKNQKSQHNDMDIKIGVFEAAVYIGVVHFRLNPLKSEKADFHHLWAKNEVF